jgi:hypothetical protein
MIMCSYPARMWGEGEEGMQQVQDCKYIPKRNPGSTWLQNLGLIIVNQIAFTGLKLKIVRNLQIVRRLYPLDPQ